MIPLHPDPDIEVERLGQPFTHGRRRLQALVNAAAHVPKARKPTRPTLASKQRRLAGKASRAQIKQGRGRVSGSE